MRFRKRAKLDPFQVEDYRGQGGGLGGLGGGKILGGGGGVVGIIVLVLYLVIASQGGGLGELGSLAGQTVGPGTPNTELATECRTGAGRKRARGLPHRRLHQQRAGLLGEDASRLRAGDDAVLRRADAAPAAAPRPPPSVRSTVRPTAMSTSTSASSTSSSRSSARRAARSPRRTSSRTSTGTTSRTSLGDARSAQAATRARSAARCGVELQADCYAGVWIEARVGHAASSWAITQPRHRSRARRRRRRGRRPDPGSDPGTVTRSRGRTARPSSGSAGSSSVSSSGPNAATRSGASSSRALTQERQPDERRHDDPYADRQRDADDRELPGVVARRIAAVADRPPHLFQRLAHRQANS